MPYWCNGIYKGTISIRDTWEASVGEELSNLYATHACGHIHTVALVAHAHAHPLIFVIHERLVDDENLHSIKITRYTGVSLTYTNEPVATVEEGEPSPEGMAMILARSCTSKPT